MDASFVKNLSFQGIIGLSGVIIASVSLGWNILNEIRKTPRARVYVMISNIIQPGLSKQDDRDYLSITVSNVGLRPLRINHIAYDSYKWWWHPFKKTHFVILARNIPAYLKDGEEHNEHFPYTPQQFKELLDHNIQNFYVIDSAGRNHYLSRRRFINFRKHVKEHVRKNYSPPVKMAEVPAERLRNLIQPVQTIAELLETGKPTPPRLRDLALKNYVIIKELLLELK